MEEPDGKTIRAERAIERPARASVRAARRTNGQPAQPDMDAPARPVAVDVTRKRGRYNAEEPSEPVSVDLNENPAPQNVDAPGAAAACPSRASYESALRALGFRLMPAAPADLRAVRGFCEVHIYFREGGLDLGIPVVRLGRERPVTPELLKYLDDRNSAGKGPGKFSIEEGAVWYRAQSTGGRADEVAALALSMQLAAEKLGPKVLNVIH